MVSCINSIRLVSFDESRVLQACAWLVLSRKWTHASFFPSGHVVVAPVLSSFGMSSATHVAAIWLKLR